MKFSVRNKGKGFTLIELLVSMGLSMLVLAAIGNLFVTQFKAFHLQEQVNEMQQSSRGAVDLMAREIKMTGYDPTGIGFAAIDTFTTGQFRFKANLNSNGVVTDANEDIDYSLDAGNNQILRSDNGAPGVALADNITALGFQYFKADGTTAGAAADIRLIQVTITARTSKADPNYPNDGGYRTFTLLSLITANNLAL